jgi:hypothetical protein
MDDPARVRVVEIEAVHQDAVDEGCVARRQACGQADDGHAALAAEAGNGGHGLVGELVAAGGEGDAGGIEHEVFGPLAHLLRDGRRRQAVGEARERLRDQLRLRFRALGLIHRAWHHGHSVSPCPPAFTRTIDPRGPLASAWHRAAI